MHNVTFAYPSRPGRTKRPLSLAVLVPEKRLSRNSSCACTTRRTVPSSQDVSYLNETWMHYHIAGISQGCIMFDMSIHDNVAMGLAALEVGGVPGTQQERR
jgi:ATP-binding cassette subfamily B (MDR/TAP) protein 1